MQEVDTTKILAYCGGAWHVEDAEKGLEAGGYRYLAARWIR